MTSYRSKLVAGLAAGIVMTGAVAHAAPPAEAAKAAFLKYCSACHGSGGKGDGVVSGLMTPPPSDLTILAKKADGKFPFNEVMHAIDGTRSVRAHGDPDMPVWGDIFRSQSTLPLSAQAQARGMVLLLTEHLQSIQAQ